MLAVRDTGTGIPAARAAARVRALPSRRRTRSAHARRHGHRPGAGAGTGAAARRHDRVPRAPLGRARTFTVAIPLGTAHLPPDQHRAPRHACRRRHRRARLTSRRRCAGCPRRRLPPSTPASTHLRPGHRCRRCGTARARPHPARRRQRRHARLRAPPAGRSVTTCDAVADGEAALAPSRQQPPGPGADRRDDAAARRLRPAARSCAPIRARATCR